MALPPEIQRVSVEAGVTLRWQRWVGGDGECIGIEDRFGASAPYQIVMREPGFTVENVAARACARRAATGVRA
jgi:transketolase